VSLGVLASAAILGSKGAFGVDKVLHAFAQREARVDEAAALAVVDALADLGNRAAAARGA